MWRSWPVCGCWTGADFCSSARPRRPNPMCSFSLPRRPRQSRAVQPSDAHTTRSKSTRAAPRVAGAVAAVRTGARRQPNRMRYRHATRQHGAAARCVGCLERSSNTCKHPVDGLWYRNAKKSRTTATVTTRLDPTKSDPTQQPHANKPNETTRREKPTQKRRAALLHSQLEARQHKHSNADALGPRRAGHTAGCGRQPTGRRHKRNVQLGGGGKGVCANGATPQ